MEDYEPSLSVNLGALRMQNPVMVASGTFGCGEEYQPLVDLRSLGAIVVKGITLHPRPGNKPPRIAETPCGMLNAIGLENIGVRAFREEKLPWLLQFGVPIIANVCGNRVEEFAAVVSDLEGARGISALEINISCPNIEHVYESTATRRTRLFAQDPETVEKVVASVRGKTGLPLLVKLSPNVTDIREIGARAVGAGADCLSLINTLLAMSVDVKEKKPKLGNVTGGLSGPAVRPVAVRMVWELARAVPVPIVGMGGIMTTEDALEFLLAGATAVAVGTANFVNPAAASEISSGIREYLRLNGIRDVNKLREYGKEWG